MSHASTTAAALPYSAGTRRSVRSLVRAAIWSGFAHTAWTLAARYQERRRMIRAVAELSALSDRTLKDIGIGRHDIARMARDGRDRTDRRR